MEKINPSPGKNGSAPKNDTNLPRIVKTIIVAIILLVLLLILIATGQLLFFYQMFGWIQYRIRGLTGSDMLIANAITAILMAIILTFPFWGFLRSFLPFPQKHKKLYRASAFLIFAIFMVAAYFFSQDVFFDANTGEPMKYYTISPNGQYRFNSSGGYDYTTGDTFKVVTRDVVLEYLAQEDKTPNTEDKKLPINNIEKSLFSYQGQIENSTHKTVCLMIAPHLNSDDLALFRTIPPKKSLIISLVEGTHLCTILNADGKEILLKPQKNNLSKIINSTVSYKTLTQHEYNMREDDNMGKLKKNNGAQYGIWRLYYLDIIPQNNWQITITDSTIVF